MLAFSIFSIVIFLVITFFFAFTPYFTRKTESFGVTIPEEVYYEPEIKKIREFYRNAIVILGMLLIILFIILLLNFPLVIVNIFWVSFIVLEIFASFGFYLNGHFKMKKLKKEKNWLEGKKEFIIASIDAKQKKMPSPVWFLFYLLIIAITLVVGVGFYDKIPEKIIIQWDMNFNPSKIVDKSYLVVLFPVLIQLFLSFVFILSYFVIVRARQQIDPSKPEESKERNLIFKSVWANFIIFAGLLMMGVFLFMEISYVIKFSPITLMVVILGITGMIVLASVYISVKVGQGGSRIKLEDKKKEKNFVARDDDKYWKLGVFYFNPDDPVVFVEKRFGIGWTCNWARPLSWTLVLGLLLLIGIIIVISVVSLK